MHESEQKYTGRGSKVTGVAAVQGRAWVRTEPLRDDGSWQMPGRREGESQVRMGKGLSWEWSTAGAEP